MGISDSNIKHIQIDEKYKLIRRYTSDCYGDLTVIQNKQTQNIYALKQIITQDDMIVKFVQNRKKLKHKNLIILQDYWFSGDQSICSNIRKIQMIFSYYSCTLDQEMYARTERGQGFGDLQILQILTDSIECLEYLNLKNILHFIGSMKMLLYDKEFKCIKIIENQQIIIHSQRSKKKQLNIIGFLGNKKIMPLHPLNEPKDVCDVCLDNEKIIHQNLFILGLISLGLCWMRQPLDLNIFGKGGYIFNKIDKRIQQIKNKYPYTYKILSLYLNQKNINSKTTYSAVLAQIYSIKKSFTKQNDKNQRLIDIQPVEKVGDKKPKKLSYLRQMRLSNNDIPNQF